MLKRIHVNRYIRICTGVILSVLLFVKCIDREAKNLKNDATVKSEQFAGSAVCANCHKNIYDSHIHTPHYLTTRPASAEYIKGSFDSGKNRYAYDSDVVVIMEKRDSGYYQVGYHKGHPSIIKRFDIVVGSGSKGQTYITRFKNRLYQLPVSYFSAADRWANSPQYPTRPVLFNRAITSRCLECHTTFAHKISAPGHLPEEFDNEKMIYGVDCEKCHGPAAKHVEFQTQNPKDTTAKYILNPASFSRQQNLDLCGLCHGGRMKATKPHFAFVSGDKLTDYFQVDSAVINPENIDMHGNQLGLLKASKCFRMSQMTCTTCHNPHENERGKVELFSQRCLTCHSNGHNSTCKMTASIGPSINSNCIDCHMPRKPSKVITELLPGDTKPTAALVRSHLIAIYLDETSKFKNRLHK